MFLCDAVTRSLESILVAPVRGFQLIECRCASDEVRLVGLYDGSAGEELQKLLKMQVWGWGL